MSSSAPIVMFAFANDSDEHLASLKTESRDLYRVLQPLADQECIAIHREESADLDELYHDLLSFDGRLCIFHYGGHSDGTSLELEGGRGGASGLAKLLGRQPQLKLVFLNGCANKNQVAALHRAGVPAVIATAVKINDARATEFSGAFYKALAKDDSIFSAFDKASAFLEAQHGDAAPTMRGGMRGGMLSGFDEEFDEAGESTDEFEWGLYVQEAQRKDLQAWRLATAREQAKLQLRDDAGVIKDLDGKALTFERIEKIRSGPYFICANCTAQTSVVSEDAHYKCPVCASTKVSSLDDANPQYDEILPATLSRKDAEKISCEQLDCSVDDLESLELVYVPYWLFKAGVRASFSGERGDVVDFEADNLEPQWEVVKGNIDLSVTEFGVPAYLKASPATLLDDEWAWSFADLKTATEHQPTAPQLSICTTAQDAFSVLSHSLANECEDQAYSRVGGQQQKNIEVSTAYKNLELSTVQLPHWFVTVNKSDGVAALAINAQSGATAVPNIPNIINSQSVVENTMKQKIDNAQTGDKPTSKWASLFAGVGIGLMVGLLLGLAAPAPPAKTVVSVFIGAVGVVLAALLGLNDRNFSTAKSLRIGGFGLAVVLSALSGMYIKEHGLVGRTLAERADEYTTVFPDMKPKDVRRALAAEDRLFYTGKAGSSSTPAKKSTAPNSDPAPVEEEFTGITSRTGMYSAEAVSASSCEDLQNIDGGVSDAELTILDFEKADPQAKLGWKKLVNESKKLATLDAQANFLLIARDGKCGSARNAPIEYDSAACAVLRNNRSDVESVEKNVDSTSELAKVLASVYTRFDADDKKIAVDMLSAAICTEYKNGEQQ